MIKRGSSHYNAKLDEDAARLVIELAEHRDQLRAQAKVETDEARRKSLYAEAKMITNRKIAEKMDVSLHAIDRILYLGGWSHV